MALGNDICTGDHDPLASAQTLDPQSARSDGHAAALSDISQLRVALDQTLVELDTPIGAAREIAIFPPMTGG